MCDALIRKENPYPNINPDQLSFHPLLEQMRSEIYPKHPLNSPKTSFFPTQEGIKLFVRYWPALSPTKKGKIVVFRGMGG